MLTLLYNAKHCRVHLIISVGFNEGVIFTDLSSKINIKSAKNVVKLKNSAKTFGTFHLHGIQSELILF